MKFVVVGNRAVRDGTVAEMKEWAKQAGIDPAAVFSDTAPVVEFETTARVNDFFRVVKLTVSGATATPTGQFYARTSDEIFEQAGDNAAIAYEKVSVFPYLATAERGPRVKREKTAHG